VFNLPRRRRTKERPTASVLLPIATSFLPILLRLARLDAGQETLRLASCDARALIQSVVADLSPSLDVKGQQVDITVQPGAETLRGDPAKLHEALRNLIASAGSYAPKQTTIRIEVLSQGGRLAIAVSDQGPGIPDENLSRIFERFYRVDKSRGRDPGGTGSASPS
jgi:signal transduction histidine kinase